MASKEVVQRMAARAKEAETLVSSLKKKIAVIRETFLSSYFKQEEMRLRSENEKYTTQVESLKSRLTRLQKQNGAIETEVPAVTNDKKAAVSNQENKAVKKSEEIAAEKQPKEKKAKQNTKKPDEPELPVDIRRLNMRVGKIISVKKHPDADSLYVEQVEVGEANPRTVVSGLVKFVPIEEMSDRMVILMCNLKPAKMRGILSQAMVMCASTPDKVEILSPPPGSVPGEPVEFDGYPSDQADAQLNPKKKIFEQVAPDLRTNDAKVATYKGIPFRIGTKGFVTAQSLTNVQIK